MKKFLIGIIVTIVLLVLLGGIFFLIDKAEYFSKGETFFTINEDMGDNLTRRIGLGYVMYTRNTGFPNNENDNIISSWFKAVKRDEAIEILLKDKILFENLSLEENQVVKYYSYLLMTSLNSKGEELKEVDTNTIFVNFDKLEDLQTSEKISKPVIEAIKDTLKQKLNNPEIKIENSNTDELSREEKIQSTIVRGYSQGIYVDINRVELRNEVEVKLVQIEIVNSFRTKESYKAEIKYSFNTALIKESVDGNIFTEVK